MLNENVITELQQYQCRGKTSKLRYYFLTDMQSKYMLAGSTDTNYYDLTKFFGTDCLTPEVRSRTVLETTSLDDLSDESGWRRIYLDESGTVKVTDRKGLEIIAAENPKGRMKMHIYLTDQPRRRINSVQLNPMKHCTESSI